MCLHYFVCLLQLKSGRYVSVKTNKRKPLNTISSIHGILRDLPKSVMNTFTGFEKVKSNQGAVLLSFPHYINQSICKA